MRALITRPEAESQKLAKALVARGIEPLIEPLLSIRDRDDASIDLDGIQAILVTSSNGVRALARLTDRRDVPMLAVGHGSAETARELGFTSVQSGEGDVASLAAMAKDRLRPEDGTLIHVAGSVVAGDLQGELESAGFVVGKAQLYEAVPASEFSAPTRANLSLGGIDWVILFSPRTARIFGELWRKSGSPSLARVTALCLSKAVEAEIADLGWTRIVVAAKPDLPSMLALVDALQERIASMPDETPDAEVKENATEPAAAVSQAAEAERPPESKERKPKGGIIGGLIAGAIGGILVSASAPYWLPAIGVGAGGATDASTKAIAALEQTLKEKAGPADILAATDPMQQRMDALDQQLQSAHEDLASLKDAIDQLKSAAAMGQGSVAPGPTVDLGPIEDRLGKLEQSISETATRVAEAEQAQAAPTQMAEAARQALESENRALRDRIDELSRKIDETAAMAPRLGEIEARLDQVPSETKRQQRAALIVALGQLQSALSDDGAFASELRTVQDIAKTDQAMWDRVSPVMDVLSPFADAGVPTPSQLAAGFPGTQIARAAEADIAGSLLEDAPWWKRLMHRMSEVVTVRPVGGDVEGDGPLERLARAEADLGEGDLAAAIHEVDGISGTAANAASDWLQQAKARMAVDEAATSLAEMSARALEPEPDGSG